jgi:Remorin, C-terminal region
MIIIQLTDNNIYQRGESNANNAHDDLEHARTIASDVGGFEETNPLALVPNSNPIPSPQNTTGELVGGTPGAGEDVSVGQVRREETEVKITAWQTAEVAKINNRLKREEVIINGWENAQVEKATAQLKKIEVVIVLLILLPLMLHGPNLIRSELNLHRPH